MADHEDEDLQMALRMSLHQEPPEAKRIKPRENAAGSVLLGISAAVESPEVRERRMKRETLAAAAERRMMTGKAAMSTAKLDLVAENPAKMVLGSPVSEGRENLDKMAGKAREIPEKFATSFASEGKKLLMEDAENLFMMVFGGGASVDIIKPWCNQGIRFSSDPETSMGLVQHEGGPCGVLAPIQGFLLKYLLFCRDETQKSQANMQLKNSLLRRGSESSSSTLEYLSSFSEAEKIKALILSMVEILFNCGSKQKAVLASLDIPGFQQENRSDDAENQEIVVAKPLEGFSIQSASDLHKVLQVHTHTSEKAAFDHLKAILHVYQSPMGAMLFLLSSVLSRGLDTIVVDRDDPTLPFVTAPFGHASQEIVNLLLCGRAVPNVFDDQMDFGGGMFLKGVPTSVEIGYLTLLESLGFCKVGQYFKCPKWPVWVVGSETHYTVIFAVDTTVQDQNELEKREFEIRGSFDAQDQSGGGGFISSEGFQHVLRETNISMPPDQLESLSGSGFVVWSEFRQVLSKLDTSLGGLNDPSGLIGKKHFDLYHFNGIAKSVSNGNRSNDGESGLQQKPRLTKLSVVVPLKWTPEEYMAESSKEKDGCVEVDQPQRSQHAQLVDCIKTRWPLASCSWVGDPPSIV